MSQYFNSITTCDYGSTSATCVQLRTIILHFLKRIALIHGPWKVDSTNVSLWNANEDRLLNGLSFPSHTCEVPTGFVSHLYSTLSLMQVIYNALWNNLSNEKFLIKSLSINVKNQLL